MVERVNIPVASVPIIRPDGKPVLLEKPWYQLLQGLAKAHNDLAVDNAIDTDLASEVTGVLPVANGGTGKATLSTYRVLAGGTTATGALQQLHVQRQDELPVNVELLPPPVLCKLVVVCCQQWQRHLD
jgi:hypothetical protein